MIYIVFTQVLCNAFCTRERTEKIFNDLLGFQINIVFQFYARAIKASCLLKQGVHK